MNFKKMITVVLLISIFMMGAVSAMEETPVEKTTSNTGKVTKASLKVSAPSVTNVYKKSQTFKVSVNNKNTGKAMKNVKVNIKIGKKKYNKKTNSKGTISINTKSLKKGTYKVVIKIKATKKYKKASAKSSIKIVKSSKQSDNGKIPTSINYRTGLVFHATTSSNGWTMHSHTYSVDVHVILKDKNGKELYKPVTLYHSDGYSASGKSGETITVSGGRPGTVTLKFNGDSKYQASEYTFNLGNEPF